MRESNYFIEIEIKQEQKILKNGKLFKLEYDRNINRGEYLLQDWLK